MENFTTGSPKTDYVLLGISWVGSLASWQLLPIALSSIASLLVIYNQWSIAKKNKKQ